MELFDSILEGIGLRRMDDRSRKFGCEGIAIEVDGDPFVYGEQGLWCQRSICIDDIASTLGHIVEGREELLRLSFGELIGGLLRPRVNGAEAMRSEVSTLDGSACCDFRHLVLHEGRLFFLGAKQGPTASFMPIIAPEGPNHWTGLARQGTDETVQFRTESKHGIGVLREHQKVSSGAVGRWSSRHWAT